MIRLCLIVLIILIGCISSDSGHSDTEPSNDAKRTLAILATPVNNPDIPPNGYEDAISLAATAGNTGIQTTVLWEEVEPERGKYDFSDLLHSLKLGKGLKPIFTIRVPDTGLQGLPGYLEGRPFDDPEVLQRLNLMIDAALAVFEDDPLVVCIGNEVDVYLSKNMKDLESFKKLQTSVFSHLRASNSDALLGTTFTYDGFEDNDMKEVLTQLAAPGDALVITYYPSDAADAPGPPTAPHTDFPEMVKLVAAGKPIILQEFGFSTAPNTPDTLARQSAFVDAFFDAWDDTPQIRFVSWFYLHDLGTVACDRIMAFYKGLVPDELLPSLRISLCHAGLRNADGSPKPAWDRFRTRGIQMDK